jgi:hypothetical protein
VPNRTDLAAGQVTNHDRILIDLIQPPDSPAFIAITRPLKASIRPWKPSQRSPPGGDRLRDARDRARFATSWPPRTMLAREAESCGFLLRPSGVGLCLRPSDQLISKIEAGKRSCESVSSCGRPR